MSKLFKNTLKNKEMSECHSWQPLKMIAFSDTNYYKLRQAVDEL